MGLFDKIKKPIFLKESDSLSKQLDKMQELLQKAPENIKHQIEREIYQIKAGVLGEQSIDFELRNSHIPMYVLHDLYITNGDLSAQIDYLIITRKCNFIIECKNLYGNIEINSSGDFIRTINYKGRTKKEGMYSPITQNKRHLELLKKVRSELKTSIFTKDLFEWNTDERYVPIVVLSNPKTILNAKYAKQEVKEQVIRVDHLIDYIKNINDSYTGRKISEKEMSELANFFFSCHKENPTDYTKKYQNLIENSLDNKPKDEPDDKVSGNEKDNSDKANILDSDNTLGKIICPKCSMIMVRRKASRGENAGKEFYGCSNFPKCRYVLNIKKQ